MRVAIAVLILFALAVLVQSSKPVNAKSEEATVSDCIMIAKTGELTVYRCEDYDRGVYFYMNNFGFMIGDSY